MKRIESKLPFVLAVVLSLASVRSGFARLALQRHWRETDSETIWTSRYNNCDYGYYVLLPRGVVGHDTLPPSPNHGFYIPLPDVGTTKDTADLKDRFIWVDASYNVTEAQSLAGLIDDKEKEGSKTLARTKTKIGGVPAIEITTEYKSEVRAVTEMETVALRAGIVYTIGMRTSRTNLTSDETEYRRIIQGFRLLKLPRGQCSNG